MRKHWRPDEIELVAAEAVRLQGKFSYPDMAAIKQAQTKVLPKDRWRKNIQMSQRFRIALEHHRQLTKAPAPTPPQPVDIGQAAVVLLNHLIDMSDKLDKMYNRIMSIPAATSYQPPQWDNHYKAPYVLIAGLLPDQVKAVGNAIGSKASIDTWNRNGHTVANPDFLVLMTGFAGHDMDNEIKKSGIKIVHAGRGVSSAIWAVQRGLKELEQK